MLKLWAPFCNFMFQKFIEWVTEFANDHSPVRVGNSGFKSMRYFHGRQQPGGPSYADKMREILPKTGWLFLQYFVCVLCQSV